MKEIKLRKWHRRVGLLIAVFVVFQILSGIVLSIEDIIGTYWGGTIRDIHYGYGLIGSIYRILLCTAIVWMVASGGIIAIKIRQRSQQK